jgi:thiol:disulfide interchange protein
MRLAFGILISLSFGPEFLFGQEAKAPDPPSPTAGSQAVSRTAQTYHSERSAAADIDRAIIEAQKTGKRILLDVGGDWCSWCRALDRLMQENPDVLRIRDRNFVTVPVYYSSENKNGQVLSHYSKVLGIPHLFVLDETGRLLHSQHMIELQSNGNYTPEKMKEFFSKWSPPSANASHAELDSTSKIKKSN